MTNMTIGVSCGDVNGVGLEVILKALAIKKALPNHKVVLYASTKVVAYHKNIISQENIQFFSVNTPAEAQPGRMNILNCWHDNININLGKVTDVGGRCAMESLERATRDLKEGLIDALVTAPIHKKAMQLAGFGHIGHTEYLTEALKAKDSLMLMVSDDLRIGLATNHLPLSAVAGAITKEVLLRKIRILHETLRIDFGISNPTLAILGLNPHAGDEGAIGTEEETIIRPAIEEAKLKGVFAFGPFPADGFFGSGEFKKFDGILAMYHDQGLVPFKTLAFGGGVNYTAGLSGIRTSPDHGTAFDLAGKGEADESSFLHALHLAIDIAHNRSEYLDMRSDSIERRKQKALQAENGADEDPIELIPEE